VLILAGQGTNIDTATSSGKLIFGIFAALAEFERELIQKSVVKIPRRDSIRQGFYSHWVNPLKHIGKSASTG
jgi:DNA invertase Pin-like site-specific DNA recombinase